MLDHFNEAGSHNHIAARYGLVEYPRSPGVLYVSVPAKIAHQYVLVKIRPSRHASLSQNVVHGWRTAWCAKQTISYSAALPEAEIRGVGGLPMRIVSRQANRRKCRSARAYVFNISCTFACIEVSSFQQLFAAKCNSQSIKALKYTKSNAYIKNALPQALFLSPMI